MSFYMVVFLFSCSDATLISLPVAHKTTYMRDSNTKIKTQKAVETKTSENENATNYVVDCFVTSILF